VRLGCLCDALICAVTAAAQLRRCVAAVLDGFCLRSPCGPDLTAMGAAGGLRRSSGNQSWGGSCKRARPDARDARHRAEGRCALAMDSVQPLPLLARCVCQAGKTHKWDATVDLTMTRALGHSGHAATSFTLPTPRVDTFFIASTSLEPDRSEPTRGVDMSHRGGPSGFVRVAGDGQSLRWADYTGNNFFMTLGNVSSAHAVCLLFVDYESGALLRVHGSGRRATLSCLRLCARLSCNADAHGHALRALWCTQQTLDVVQ
jgi:hypothetical protein